MSHRWKVRFTSDAAADLERIYKSLFERDRRAGERDRHKILKALEMLELFPRSCRRAIGTTDDSLRELVISFGKRGDVALFRLHPPATVSALAVRHQREDDLR